MEIKILFENGRLSHNFLKGWGVSYLVDNRVLFDTGERSNYLFNNMDRMGIDISRIQAIVISHDHWDHTNGLWDILARRPGLDLYTCPGFSSEFKDRLSTYACNTIEAESFTKIYEGIYTTGQIEGEGGLDYIAEQALVLATDKGLTIMTGCAHPGIIKIVEHAMNHMIGEVYLVMGGFHLLDNPLGKIKQVNNKFRQLGVRHVGPGHCTGEDAVRIFHESYKERFIDIRVGKTFEV
jgi:7,8-dihydropterin-6-yl-methyl-4-(beta-D-ribofuranosyl)aminobenzene 5'-phosphate synthase